MKNAELEEHLRDLHGDAFLWARQCTNFSSIEAEEVLQQVYLKILEGKAKFSGHAGFRTWLFAVIRNTAIDHHRRRIKFETLEEAALAEVEGTEPDGIDYEKILQLLPEQQARVLLLVFYHECTLAEAAEIMQISQGSVSTHYARGKKRLRQILENKNVWQDE